LHRSKTSFWRFGKTSGNVLIHIIFKRLPSRVAHRKTVARQWKNQPRFCFFWSQQEGFLLLLTVIKTKYEASQCRVSRGRKIDVTHKQSAAFVGGTSTLGQAEVVCCTCNAVGGSPRKSQIIEIVRAVCKIDWTVAGNYNRDVSFSDYTLPPVPGCAEKIRRNAKLKQHFTKKTISLNKTRLLLTETQLTFFSCLHFLHLTSAEDKTEGTSCFVASATVQQVRTFGPDSLSAKSFAHSSAVLIRTS